MHLLTGKYAELDPDARFVSVIHDENIYQVKETELDLARAKWDEALAWVNEVLGWSVDMRTGWAVGDNMYEAK